MLSKIQNVKCIDFEYSSIGWKTKKDSQGIFRIDAVLKEKKKKKLKLLRKNVLGRKG